MKKNNWVILFLVTCGSGIAWMACKDAQARYIDLNSGDKITLEKDKQGRIVNGEDKKPVRFYVDTKSNDTIDARTGKVVNGELVIMDGSYEYISVRDFLVSDEEYNKKVEKDGDVKIKTADKKVKIDSETGEKKVKDN